MREIIFINPENVSNEEIKSYPTREAARAVVLDKDGNIALLHSRKFNYYKLPGGGIDEDTDKISALRRECLEEIGCDVEVIKELGLVREWRKFCSLQQISYCYLAKVVGEKGEPQFTESEIGEMFEEVWLPYDEALSLIKANVSEVIQSKFYVVAREVAILESAKDILANKKFD